MERKQERSERKREQAERRSRDDIQKLTEAISSFIAHRNQPDPPSASPSVTVHVSRETPRPTPNPPPRVIQGPQNPTARTGTPKNRTAIVKPYSDRQAHRTGGPPKGPRENQRPPQPQALFSSPHRLPPPRVGKRPIQTSGASRQVILSSLPPNDPYFFI